MNLPPSLLVCSRAPRRASRVKESVAWIYPASPTVQRHPRRSEGRLLSRCVHAPGGEPWERALLTDGDVQMGRS